jgi:2-methylisocitrate lyase-like PEP mutase family enzyme
MNQDGARAATLRSKLDVHRPAVAMAAHNPLAAKLAAGAGFDAIWGSSFELSASYAVPDASILSMDVHLEMMRAMGEVQDAPVIADIDTGFGNAVNVAYVVPRYSAAGVAAVVIEDKTFPKDSSLRPGGRQELLPIGEFQGKLTAAKAVGTVLVIARTEALIAGLGQERGAPTRRGLCRSWRGWRADPQQTEDTGRNHGVLPSLARSRASGPGAYQLPATDRP